ncbi:MAG: NUDIX domain-containing protein [Pseudomonadota bacterium]|nr:NUDIX domain-containing protein [Pseudomonadota bacterium]
METTQPPRPAATLLLVRDHPRGMQVFMVKRHHQIDFAGGALVFPGGKVDQADTLPSVLTHCRPLPGISPDDMAFRVASIREAFEECGVLLARERMSGELIRAAALADLERRYRQAVETKAVYLGDVASRENLELATDRLTPFAHWITPVMAPKRFDTHFFLAEAPEDQVALHDGGETVDSLWIRPQDALEQAAAGTLTIIWPTRMNLQKLARHHHVADTIAAARDSTVVTVLPEMAAGPNGQVMRIPETAGYGISEIPIHEVMGGRPSPAPRAR